MSESFVIPSTPIAVVGIGAIMPDAVDADAIGAAVDVIELSDGHVEHAADQRLQVAVDFLDLERSFHGRVAAEGDLAAVIEGDLERILVGARDGGDGQAGQGVEGNDLCVECLGHGVLSLSRKSVLVRCQRPHE